jgi:hypothetical protein
MSGAPVLRTFWGSFQVKEVTAFSFLRAWETRWVQVLVRGDSIFDVFLSLSRDTHSPPLEELRLAGASAVVTDGDVQLTLADGRVFGLEAAARADAEALLRAMAESRAAVAVERAAPGSSAPPRGAAPASGLAAVTQLLAGLAAQAAVVPPPGSRAPPAGHATNDFKMPASILPAAERGLASEAVNNGDYAAM